MNCKTLVSEEKDTHDAEDQQDKTNLLQEFLPFDINYKIHTCDSFNVEL